MSQHSAGMPAFHAPLSQKSLEIRGSRREPEPLTACPLLSGAPAAYSTQAQAGDSSQGAPHGNARPEKVLQPREVNSAHSRAPCPPLTWLVSSSPRRTSHQLLQPREGTRGRGLPQEHMRRLPPATPQQRTSPTWGSQVRELTEDPRPFHRPAHSCRERGGTN